MDKSDIARALAALRKNPGGKGRGCQCGTCGKCKQREYRRTRRAEGKDRLTYQIP